jgi:hypothetical protein
MAWECAEDCGEKEQENHPILVCHHCGKPVCRKHREVITDDAFSANSNLLGHRAAVHCADCKKDYHPRTSNLERETLGVTPS